MPVDKDFVAVAEAVAGELAEMVTAEDMDPDTPTVGEAVTVLDELLSGVDGGVGVVDADRPDEIDAVELAVELGAGVDEVDAFTAAAVGDCAGVVDGATVPDGVVDADAPKVMLADTAAVVDADADTPVVFVAVMALELEALGDADTEDWAVAEKVAEFDADTPPVTEAVAVDD